MKIDLSKSSDSNNKADKVLSSKFENQGSHKVSSTPFLSQRLITIISFTIPFHFNRKDGKRKGI